MYNLRSNKKDTIQLPVQIQVADDDKFLTDLLHHNSSSLNGSANMLDSVHESSDSEIDCDPLINESDDETQSTSVKSDKNNHLGAGRIGPLPNRPSANRPPK